MSFFEELKRRNVFKVAAAYIIISWLIMQAGDTLAPALRLPEWINSALAFFLILGFPLAMFFAWAFEMTPEGIKKEKNVERNQSIALQTGKKLNNTILVLMTLAIGYLFFDKFSAQPGSDPFSQQDSEQSTPADEKRALTPIEAEPVISRQSIAVLPFINRSNREEDQFFTDGIHDDLLTTIARIGSMKVISRTSVMEYKNTTKKIPEIAKELGVANILEGGIQRSGDQVRINVQLIDAVTDEHLWAEIYDRELTANNLFAIQSEISKAIAEALEVTLAPEEAQRIDSRPTGNLEAYEAYLNGRQLIATRESEKIKLAIEKFNKAVKLDPQFALAWVGVADSHNLLSVYGTLNSEEAIPIRQGAIDHALQIDDQLGEAYVSLGSLYENTHQSQEAEGAYQKSIELSPNYATAYHWYANYLSGFPLRAQQSLELARKAAELDPRSSIIGTMLGSAYIAQGLYSLAERQFQKVVELDPDFAQGYQSLVRLYTFSTGQFDKAIVASRKSTELDPGFVMSAMNQAVVYLQLRDIASAEAVRNRIEDVSNQHWSLGWTDVMIAQTMGNPKAAREALNWVLPKLKSQPFFAHLAALQALALGDKNESREIFLNTNPGWIDPQQWQGLINQHAREACAFSWILINTGDEVLGRQLLEQTTKFLDVDLAAVNEHVDVLQPEVCYLTAGDTEKALISIEQQLADNHLFGWNIFHKMPMYEAIHFEPRYQAALAERERRIAVQREAIAKVDAGAKL